MSSTPDTPIVIVSNRGPLTYDIVEGELQARRGGGGLVSGLAPLLASGQARWIAAAMSDGDRIVAERAAGNPGAAYDPDGLNVDLIALDPKDQRLFYDEISNGTLWFLHHGLYDLVRAPSYGDTWWDAWEAYKRVNRAFAERVAEVAAQGATVLVQDYHLTLLPQTLAGSRPDLTLVHFHHTPFAGPDNLRVMPDRARDEMLTSLLSHHAIGFHTSDWAMNFGDSAQRFLRVGPGQDDGVDTTAATVFTATLSSDINDIAATAETPECNSELDRIESMLAGRRLLVRVDRMELSKNIVRGFEAFDLLLERRPDLRSEVIFMACCYPSREGVPEYAAYRDEVIEAAQQINARWADSTWTPIELQTDDNFARSVAALRRYDVLLVNPIRDGLNLVAKEGPLLNENSGRLVLSTQAGAWTELNRHAFGVNPFDVSGTADALGEAFDLVGPVAATAATKLAELAGERTPADWLQDQLNAAQVNRRVV